MYLKCIEFFDLLFICLLKIRKVKQGHYFCKIQLFVNIVLFSLSVNI